MGRDTWEKDTWEKPKLVEKNCITCDLGDKPFSKICWECMTKGKSRWRKKKKKRRKRV